MNQSENRYGGTNTFCFPVTGNSMYNPGGGKSYKHGDFVTVDPDREPVNGSMIVARLEGRSIFRQLLIEASGTKILKAINPGWPEPTITVDESVEMCGVVTGRWVREA